MRTHAKRAVVVASGLLLVAVLAQGAENHPVVLKSVTGHASPHAAAARCRPLRLRNAKPLEIGRIRIAAPGGSEVGLYRSGDARPSGCPSGFAFPEWQDVAGSQDPLLDWTLPDGVALNFSPRQPVAVVTQRSADGKRKGRGQARVTLFPMNPDDVQTHVGSLFAENRAVVVPPGQRTVVARCTVTGTPDNSRDLTVLTLAGHYGAHGTDFEVSRLYSDGSAGEILYEHHGGGTPELQRYPDDDPLVLSAGDMIEWRCTYQNDTDTTFLFGSEAAREEHCTLSGLYYPTDTEQETIHCIHVGDTGDPCTPGDLCEGGPCADPPPPTCDDGNPCTDDACDPVLGCVGTPNTASCDDGNPCTTDDTCSDGTCVGTDTGCDDGNPCTDDFCDPVNGCSHTPRDDGTSCEDGDVCTTDDECESGVCEGGFRLDCDDGDPCTVDACHPDAGCVHVPAPGLCPGDPCEDLDCNDEDPCTDDACDPALGCVHQPNTAACDDGDPCTVGDACADGVCVGGPAATCAPATPVATVEADTYVDSTKPATAFGSAKVLSADMRPAVKRIFLRVQVAGVGAHAVTSAVLHLHVLNASDAGGDSGGRVHPVGCDWSETATTWDAQPPIDASVLAAIGSVAAGDAVDVDLTPAIAGDGIYCFALDTASTNGVDYASREAASGQPTVGVAVAPECTCDPSR